MQTLRIATRNSPLALWQAEYVQQRLQEVHADLRVEIVGMTTTGDQLLDRSLAAVGGKGLFLKELEVSLLNKETDIAVHSMKDVPAKLPPGLDIPVVCEREDCRDAVVSNEYQNLYALPDGARIGTSSLRRIAQLKKAYPKLQFEPLRGNVNTRLAKLDEGQYDAIILAAAGLKRLGFEHRIKQLIAPEVCLPAVGQGIVGIECRSDDAATQQLIAPLHDRGSAVVLAAERAMNQILDGGCQVPVAGLAEVTKGRLRMRGMVADEDGSRVLYGTEVGEKLTIKDAQRVGIEVGNQLLEQGAAELLAKVMSGRPEEQGAPKVALLTRQARYRGNMPQLMSQLGYQVEAFEVIQIDPVISSQVTTHIRNLKTFTDVLFVSRNAVEIGMALLADEGASIAAETRVTAVGAETAKQLLRFGIKAAFPSRGSGIDAVLDTSGFRDLTGRRVLIFRGVHGLEWPAEEMRRRGAQVEQANIYEQKFPHDSRQSFTQLCMRHRRIHVVFLHSAIAAQHFMQLVKQQLHHFVDGCVVAGSQRIADALAELGWPYEVIVASSPANKSMLQTFAAAQQPAQLPQN